MCIRDRPKFVDEFQALGDQGIAIRPRALVTTLFSRLILSDLFLHGIGGSKYDQLTDAIMARFFEITPPNFLTLSATMKLPTDQTLVQPRDLTEIQVAMRELEFHPETQLKIDVASPHRREIESTIQSKQDWIQRELPRNQRRERHQAIVKANQQLQTHLEPQRVELKQKADHISKKIRASQILGSRECSFCLFPATLADQLHGLAKIDD